MDGFASAVEEGARAETFGAEATDESSIAVMTEGFDSGSGGGVGLTAAVVVLIWAGSVISVELPVGGAVAMSGSAFAGSELECVMICNTFGLGVDARVDVATVASGEA